MDINEDRLYREIGLRLKLRRSFLGLSQESLAKRVALKRTSITNIEGGQQKTPLHVLYRVCAALDVPITEVLPRIDQVIAPTQEEVVIGDAVRMVSPRTAKFLRSLEEEPVRRPG